jgi:hypothetical protein
MTEFNSRVFITLRSDLFPQDPHRSHAQFVFVPNCEKPGVTPTQSNT